MKWIEQMNSSSINEYSILAIFDEGITTFTLMFKLCAYEVATKYDISDSNLH